MFDDVEKKNNGRSAGTPRPPGILPLMNAEISEKKLEPPKTSAHHMGPLANFEERLNKLEARGRKRGRNFSIIGIIYSIIICSAVLISGYYIIKEINEFADQTQQTITSMTDESLISQHRIKIRPAWRSCANNEDCVETRRECCDCQNGGRQSAINKLYLSQWDEMVAEKCADKVCNEESNCENGLPVCEKNYCLFKEATSTKASCVAEAGTRIIGDEAAPDCCSGLNKIIPASEQGTDGICAMATGKFICLKCPDGTCDSAENTCNCPQDCSVATTSAATTTTDMVDADADGLSNVDEIKYGTDPKIKDSDADGFSDSEEILKGYNPLGI